MKTYKKIGLLAIVSMLVMTLVPTVNAVIPTTPTLACDVYDATAIRLDFSAGAASNYTVIEYVKYGVADDNQWAYGEGTVCVNTSEGAILTFKLEGLIVDTTYTFQAWNCYFTSRNHSGTVRSLNASCYVHLPPASASDGGSGGGGWVAPVVEDDDDTTTTPPLAIGDDILDIPGFGILAFVAAIGVCFLILKRKRL